MLLIVEVASLSRLGLVEDLLEVVRGLKGEANHFLVLLQRELRCMVSFFEVNVEHLVLDEANYLIEHQLIGQPLLCHLLVECALERLIKG